MATVAFVGTRIGLFDPPKAVCKDYIALELILVGQPVYLDPTTGKVGLCDGNAAGKYQFRGIALNTAGVDGGVTVVEDGDVTGFTLTGNYDSLVYISNTAGAYDDAVGTVTIPVGRIAPATDRSRTKVLRVFVRRDTTWA